LINGGEEKGGYERTDRDIARHIRGGGAEEVFLKGVKVTDVGGKGIKARVLLEGKKLAGAREYSNSRLSTGSLHDEGPELGEIKGGKYTRPVCMVLEENQDGRGDGQEDELKKFAACECDGI
jgi:hypothetical protein